MDKDKIISKVKDGFSKVKEELKTLIKEKK